METWSKIDFLKFVCSLCFVLFLWISLLAGIDKAVEQEKLERTSFRPVPNTSDTFFTNCREMELQEHLTLFLERENRSLVEARVQTSSLFKTGWIIYTKRIDDKRVEKE